MSQLYRSWLPKKRKETNFTINKNKKNPAKPLPLFLPSVFHLHPSMATRSTALRLVSRLLRQTATHPPPLSHLHHHHLSSPSSSLRHPQFSFASFSTATSRRQPKKIDIGARARQLQNRRLWSYALTFSGVAGFVILVLNNFQDQLVFYVTPTEALEKFNSDPSRNKFRLGGLVLEGSVHQPPSSPEMEFVVTDLMTDILIRYFYFNSAVDFVRNFAP